MMRATVDNCPRPAGNWTDHPTEFDQWNQRQGAEIACRCVGTRLAMAATMQSKSILLATAFAPNHRPHSRVLGRTLLVVVAILTLGAGCFTGRTPTKKRAAYGINGVAIVFGSALMVGGVASLFGGGPACGGDCNGGIGLGRSNSGIVPLLAVGFSLIQLAVAADIVTATVPTEPEPPAGVNAEKRPASRLTTTPRLAPTTVGAR